MPKFVLVYHGQPEGSEEGTAQKERFMEWLASLGTALVSPANPFGLSKLVSSRGVKDVSPQEALSGFSVLEVENLERAVEAAKRSPFLDAGTIEVAQLMEMTPAE